MSEDSSEKSKSSKISKYFDENLKYKNSLFENNILNQKFFLEKTITYQLSNGNSQKNKSETNSDISDSMIKIENENSLNYTSGKQKKNPVKLFNNRSLLSLITIKKIAHCNFLNEYVNDKDFYNIRVIDQIIHNIPSHVVAEFKDYLIKGDLSEFLQQYYEKKDSIIILPKIFEYYITCSVIFPNYVILPESKYIYKNIQKKQRVIDEQQEKEEKEEKNKKLNKREEEKNDTVFNTQVVDSILNQTDTSVMKKFFGLNSERNSVEDKEVMKIVNQISREEKKNISTKRNNRNGNLYKTNCNLEQYLKNRSKNNDHSKLQINLNCKVNNGGNNNIKEQFINKINKLKNFKGKIKDNKKFADFFSNTGNSEITCNTMNSNKLKNDLNENKKLYKKVNKIKKISNQNMIQNSNSKNENNTNFSFKNNNQENFMDNNIDNTIKNYNYKEKIKIQCQSANYNSNNNSVTKGRNYQDGLYENNFRGVLNTYREKLKNKDLFDIIKKDCTTGRENLYQTNNNTNIEEYSNKTYINKKLYKKLDNKYTKSKKHFNNNFYSSKKKIDIKKTLINSLLGFTHINSKSNTSIKSSKNIFTPRNCSLKDKFNLKTDNYHNKEKKNVKNNVITNRNSESMNKFIRHKKMFSEGGNNSQWLSNISSLLNISKNKKSHSTSRENDYYTTVISKPHVVNCYTNYKNIINHKKKILREKKLNNKSCKNYGIIRNKYNSNDINLYDILSKTNYKDSDNINSKRKNYAASSRENNNNNKLICTENIFTSPKKNNQKYYDVAQNKVKTYNKNKELNNIIEIKRKKPIGINDKLKNRVIPKISDVNGENKIKIIKIEKNNICGGHTARGMKMKSKINFEMIKILSTKIQKIKQRIKESSEKDSISYIFRKRKLKEKKNYSPSMALKDSNEIIKNLNRGNEKNEIKQDIESYRSKLRTPLIESKHIRCNSNYVETNYITNNKPNLKNDNMLLYSTERVYQKIKCIKKSNNNKINNKKKNNNNSKLKYSISQKDIIDNQYYTKQAACKGIPINGFDKVISSKNFNIENNSKNIPASEINRNKKENFYNIKSQRCYITNNNKYKSNVYNRKFNANKSNKNK